MLAMHHFQALTNDQLDTITGGKDDSSSGSSSGGGSWFSNQWQNVKDSWSNVKANALGGLKQMMGPAGRYSGL